MVRETGVARTPPSKLVELGTMIRNLRDHGLEEGVSTRLLVYAARLMDEGVAARRAADVAMAKPLTDDEDMLDTLRDLVEAVFPAVERRYSRRTPEENVVAVGADDVRAICWRGSKGRPALRSASLRPCSSASIRTTSHCGSRSPTFLSPQRIRDKTRVFRVAGGRPGRTGGPS